jgi:3-dehydro-L-gulonate 2-dehydrogenase
MPAQLVPPQREDSTISVSATEMLSEFSRILLKLGFTGEKAIQCAEIFTASSIDGVYTHGVNRFAKFADYVKKGYVKPAADPSLKNKFGGIEQWDGNLGAGPLNAISATERAMQLSGEHGIGCVALSNTNHWMRGGTYGWQAAKAGYVFIGFTNTIANMPAWGATDSRLGNNPLVIALPYKDEAIILDMAMSQYSFGAMELAKMKNETLPADGGFDKNGKLTREPAAIIESGRPLSIGFWKGAGLALLLDLLATVLSGGLSTHEISKPKIESGLSQVFIAIDLSKLGHYSTIAMVIESIINDYRQSVAVDEKTKIIYPGERVLATRKRNLQNGIPVMKQVWEEILKL